MTQDQSHSYRLSRRTLLAQAAVASCAAVTTRLGVADDIAPEWRTTTLSYLESLAREDGGYAWGDQPVSHLTPTFAVIASYRVLQQRVPRRAACAAFVRQHHPTEWKKLEQEHREFDYQQIQALLWLDEDVEAFRDRVARWQAPVPYLQQYERHRYPVFRFQLTAITCRYLLGMALKEISQEWKTYLASRRRPNGSFNNTPASDGSNGNVLNTWWGLESLAMLDELSDLREPTIEWIQACQAADGGFRWQPEPPHGKQSDAAYTWAALQSLKQLNAKPRDSSAAIQYLLSLRNPDGGFGDRPGWTSNAVATRYALESLANLNALSQLRPTPPKAASKRVALPEGLKVYSMQIEAHGTGSPADAVELARGLGIDLWGAKNASERWLQTARAVAQREQVPVTFFTANEEYGTWIDLPGFGTYSHMSDIIAPPGSNAGIAMNGRNQTPTWDEFRQQRIGSLHSAQGQLIWQFGENEELVRTVLDASLESGGYDAISTFHFGNPDFTNSEPFLNRYRGRVPFVALQDAHGSEPWWFADMTTGFRTLFLATEPTWKGWLAALQNNWVAAVRCDALTGGRLRMHAGSDEVATFLTAREREWRWWSNAHIARPLVSVVIVRPEDDLEAFRPERGVTIRVRCAWTNTPQGLLKEPLAELKSLVVDNQIVKPELRERKGNSGMRLSDHAHTVALPEIAAGNHRVVVTVNDLATGREQTREIQFHVAATR